MRCGVTPIRKREPPPNNGLHAGTRLQTRTVQHLEASAVIRVSRLDQSEFVLNAEFIQTVESTPDTHIVLFNGHSFVVRETADEVVARVMEYHRAVYGSVARPPLALVRD